MPIKTFSSGEVLTAADTNTYLTNSGLVYVGETNFATTTTPFINGCFTATYSNYRIIVATQGSATAGVTVRMRSGTSTPETGAVYDRFGFEATATYSSITLADQTSALIGLTDSGGGVMTSVFDCINPQTLLNTNLIITGWNAATGSQYFMNNRIQTTTRYTGIEMFAATGTLTGSMRVYGYRQA
jgi:hypothetical protein